MTLRDSLRKNMIEAMRSGDTFSRDVLRMIEGSIRNKEIEFRGLKKELSEEDILNILATQIKQRRESARQYEEGGRTDLVQKEKQEISVLEKFLPEKISSDQLKKIVQKIITLTKAKDISDIGKVIGASIVEAKKIGFVEGNEVREIANDLLMGKK
ncbi:MAG: GatB/YqeY domain-containing protein [Candidatus Moraniibacteriota bacterium]|nr:MAG: GatB/YqeY domain-containing protein [Candidatus Moranbacteria bacterium]